MELIFTVDHQNIKRIDTNKVVADSRNYLYAKFVFLSDEWDNKAVTAIFKRGIDTCHVLLDNNMCQVPPEVIKPNGFNVSVFAGDLVTCDKANVLVAFSGYADGGAPEPPTPDIYAQILAKLDSISAGTIDETKIAEAVESCIREHPELIPEGLTKEDVENIVTAYVTEHENEFKGEPGEPGADGVTPHIGENGNWYIGDEDTGNPSRGEPGYTPQKGVDYFDGEKGDPGEPGADGITPTITENADNTDNVYRLDIATAESKFTTPNLKGEGYWITPQMFGAKADGVTDDSDAIQAAIDTAPNGATLYFPKGVYAISKGLVTSNKDINIKGERIGRYIGKNDALSAHWGSIIKYIGDSDATLITQGSSDWNFTISDIILYSDACTFTDNGLDDATIPYAQYFLTKKDIVVNGIKTIQTSSLRGVAVVGMSGYGLLPAQAMNVMDCNFYACNRCIQVEKNDLMLRNCYLTASGTAIYCVGSKNIIVSNCYMDLLAEYGIYCESYLSGAITDTYIDHSNYSAVYAKGAFNNLNIDIFCGRNGMYYAGSSIDDLKNTTATTELENMSLGAAICANLVFKSQLKIHAIERPVDDAGTSSKSAPAAGLYIQQLRSGIIEGVQLKSYIRNTSNTTEPVSVNANGIISSIFKNREYKKVGLFIATYAPQSTHMASQVGDIWMHGSSVYIAIAKTDTETTWGEFGKNGYTPVKGTDYWTDDDVAEIKAYIDQQIGGVLDDSY